MTQLLNGYGDHGKKTKSDDFAALTQKYFQAPPSSVTYGSIDGNPYFIEAGKIPLRVDGHTGLFPAMGDGTSDWQGSITNYMTQRYPSKNYYVLGGARLAGRGFRHRVGLDFNDEFTAQRISDQMAALIATGKTLKAADIQSLLNEKYDEMFTNFKSQLLPQLPSSDKKDILTKWNQLCDGTQTGCGLWKSWYWGLTKVGSVAGTGVQYWDKPRFILSAFLNGDSSCGGSVSACITFASNALQAATASSDTRTVTFKHTLYEDGAWSCLCQRTASFVGSGYSASSFPDSSPSRSVFDQGCTYKQVSDYNSNTFFYQMPMGNTGWQWLRFYWYDSYLSTWSSGGWMSMSLTYKAQRTQNIVKA